MKRARTKVGIPDIAVCISVVLLAAMLLIPSRSAEASTVLVRTAEGETYYALDRDFSKTVISAGHTLTLEIKDGGVRIADSDCPDGLCVAGGWAYDSSELLVCAPAEVLVRIQGTGGDDADADFIAGR